MFDTIVIVDWSAASVPRVGRDSIWICRHGAGGETLANPPTRHLAKTLLGDWLAAARLGGERVLLGFDFPFGYPAGFAARLGVCGAPWRGVWDEIAAALEDDERNRNNRFDVAEALNRRVSGDPFPFWGRPLAPERTHLGRIHHRRHDRDGLAERRLVDLYIPSAQPCWKLLGVGSVGGQALTGIPVARALRDDPRWREHARIWPFETGLRAPPDAGVVMAEIYPSLWAVSPAPGEPKDRAQVRTVARCLAERDRAGELAALFAGDPGLSREERNRVETEEAWTLGVTAARQRPLPVSAASADFAHPAHHPPAARVPPSPRSAPTLAFPASGGGSGRGSGKGFDLRTTIQGAGEGDRAGLYTYLRNPAEISRRSFELVQAEVDLARFPRPLRPLALRLAHAAGDTSILADLAWSKGAAAAGQRALARGAPILVDATMVAAGIAGDRLPAHNEVVCTLRDPAVAGLAARLGTTRSAAAVELWSAHLAGAVVAIGNAPTALFRLLEMIAEGGATPALVLGFPVGFVGAAEAKAALADFGRGLAFVTLGGRRGGSALAAAAVNAPAGRG